MIFYTNFYFGIKLENVKKILAKINFILPFVYSACYNFLVNSELYSNRFMEAVLWHSVITSYGSYLLIRK